MHRVNRTDSDGSGNHATRRSHGWIILGATLLTCLSCSSDPSPPEEDGGSGGKSQAGSGGSAAAGDRGGALGDAGIGGSAADSGAAGEEQCGGHSATGGDATGGTSGSAGTAGGGGAALGGAAGSGGTAGVGGTAALGGSAGSGAVGGTAASAGIAGSLSSGGTAGSGGAANTAGTAGSGGAANTAGTAGSGGAANTAGTAGSGGSAGFGGASGWGGTSGSGGSAGSGGAQQGSFTLSLTLLYYFGECEIPAKMLTITNTSNVALTWHATPSLATTAVTPAGSTLAPGQAVDVSVLPATFGPSFSDLVINADIAPSQSVQVYTMVSGLEPPAAPQPEIDFGHVPIGSIKGAFVPLLGSYPSQKLGMLDDQEFSISGLSPSPQAGGFGWTVWFLPKTLGAKERTAQFISLAGFICPPNSFTVRGVGVAP